ncbi:carbohydrate ABC transporter permease [Jiangella sp. DSM 45060]|uniref:carbohydrate ABC transporter permease n=1 Tax=Jiangella sp. DSM 45060 TaxID=1798224 RepID=UPI0008796662|nr:carbohydrate ABC transporter permease [Jiangella sp. DSM 45060]SDT46840.1 carbohydrate ABC transporter membrane protein 2, CUT1 family [Jiangella sp. DSM 45060]
MSTAAATRARGRRMRMLPATVILALVGVTTAFPLLYALVTALRTQSDYGRGSLALPREITFQNLQDAWQAAGLGRLAVNSLVVVSISVAVTVLVSSMAAFALVHLGLPARVGRFGTLTALFLLALPSTVLITPIFKVTLDLGLLNSYLGLVLVYVSLSSPFGIYMMTTYFRAVPREILQAAEVDGASPVRRFVSVAIPLARPAMATLTALTALTLWNDLLFSLILIQDPQRRTLTVGVSLLESSFAQSSSAVVLTAGLLISTLPPLVLFVFMNRSLMRGLVAGALK